MMEYVPLFLSLVSVGFAVFAVVIANKAVSEMGKGFGPGPLEADIEMVHRIVPDDKENWTFVGSGGNVYAMNTADVEWTARGIDETLRHRRNNKESTDGEDR